MLSQPKTKKSEETSTESMFKFGPLRGRPEFWYEHVALCQEDPNCFRSACGYSHPERDSRSARWTWVYPADWYQTQGDKRVQQPSSKPSSNEGQWSSEKDAVSSPRAYNPWAFNNTDLRKGFGSGSLKSKSPAVSSVVPEGAKVVDASVNEEVRVLSSENLAAKSKLKPEEADSTKGKNHVDETTKKQEVGKEKFRARSKEVRRPPGFLQLDNSKHHRVEEIQSPTSGLAFTLKGGSSDSKMARRMQPRPTHTSKTLSVSSSVFPKQSSSSQSLDMHIEPPKSQEQAKLLLLWTLLCAWLLAFGDGVREAFLSASASVSVLYFNLPVLGKKQRFVSAQAMKPVIHKAKSDQTVTRKSQT